LTRLTRWARDRSALPDLKSHKLLCTAVAAQSSAKGILFPSGEALSDDLHTGKKVFGAHSGAGAPPRGLAAATGRLCNAF
jgi:hypothetical protein